MTGRSPLRAAGRTLAIVARIGVLFPAREAAAGRPKPDRLLATALATAALLPFAPAGAESPSSNVPAQLRTAELEIVAPPAPVAPGSQPPGSQPGLEPGLEPGTKADASDTARQIAALDSHSTPVDERRPLNPDGEVTINNIAGSVTVGPGDRNELRVTGALGDGIEKLDLSGDAAHMSLIVRYPKNAHHSGDAVLRLTVPPSAHVKLETVSADASVGGINGPVAVTTVSGDLLLRLASSRVSAQTVSGDITLESPSSDTQVNTVSGDMHLSELSGRIGVETVSGTLELSGINVRDLRAKSISGDLRMNLVLTADANVVADTLSGNIFVHVPPGTAAGVVLKSYSGMVYCDAGQLGASSSKKREYTIGGGGNARIVLSTFSGDVKVQTH